MQGRGPQGRPRDGEERGAEEKPEKEMGNNHQSPQRNVIHVIAGGPMDGDSRRARKARVAHVRTLQDRDRPSMKGGSPLPEITFGESDQGPLETQHSDPLVITATVAEHDVKRVLIDTGNSVDILFQGCYEQIGLEAEILPVETALYEFAGNATAPLGQVCLPLALEKGAQKVVLMTRFVLVDVPSAYNIILGRPTLNRLRAVVSTHCLKMKFPINRGVGEIKGDQVVARSCYVQSVGRPEDGP